MKPTGRPKGYKHTEATRKKMAESHKGKRSPYKRRNN